MPCLTGGSAAAAQAPPQCRGCEQSRRRYRPPRLARRGGSAGTPGPRSHRCCTPTLPARVRGSCSGSGPHKRTVKGANGQGKVNGGTAARSPLLSRPTSKTEGGGGRPTWVCGFPTHPSAYVYMYSTRDTLYTSNAHMPALQVSSISACTYIIMCMHVTNKKIVTFVHRYTLIQAHKLDTFHQL